MVPLKKTNSIPFLMKHSNSFVLASNSPRRKQLLADAGFQFDIKTIDFEEIYPEDLEASQVAEYLAIEKNKAHRAIFKQEIILTADTVVIFDGQILGKPTSLADARATLKLLSGNTHEVMSGVCISSTDKQVAFSETTSVKFRELRVSEIDYYISSNPPLDKAGSYGIQDWIGLVGVEWIKGSYNNVVGLPIHPVYTVLIDEFGMFPFLS